LQNGRENALATLVGSESVRQVLLAGVALALTAGASPAIPTVPAFAAVAGDINPNPTQGFNPDAVARPSPKPKPKPEFDVKAGVGKPNAKPEPAKDAAPKGPLQIVVSIANQHVTLYSNGARVAQGPVSTGVPGRPTPTGVFSIIQKDRFHHSNLYSNAPMPYMERITWSGVALHEGPLPGYPASHGCIRMTHEFALQLWGITKLGVRVIVARNEVVPVEFSHPSLFSPKAKPSEPTNGGDDPEKHAAMRPTAVAGTTIPQGVAAPIVAAPSDIAAPPAAAAVEGLRGTLGAVAAAPSTVSAVAQAIPATDPPNAAPPPPKAPDVVKRTGTVAVFISRREKKLYVRQGFVPLFDVPVEIEHPEQPFGTHVFTALGTTNNGTQMRWNVMTMPAEPPRVVLASKIGPKPRPEVRPEPSTPQTPAQVLDRIQIPQDAIDRIDEILSPGASLVVSDKGLGEETGEGTDFIVLAR
jgi:lipoprotein-anchoring transpeptidase ErfK/SrfK